MCMLTPQALGKNDHATRMAAMGEWNDEELRMLDRAVSKFPIGTPRRWEQARIRYSLCISVCVL